jgi:hypothetical protein
MKNDGAGQYIGRPRMPFSKAEAWPRLLLQVCRSRSRDISRILSRIVPKGGLSAGVPQLALAVLVEGDAEADDFEDVLAGASFARLRH